MVDIFFYGNFNVGKNIHYMDGMDHEILIGS